MSTRETWSGVAPPVDWISVNFMPRKTREKRKARGPPEGKRKKKENEIDTSSQEENNNTCAELLGPLTKNRNDDPGKMGPVAFGWNISCEPARVAGGKHQTQQGQSKVV